ncbi:histidinol phosphatase and related hydrolases of the PHP family [Candidatus Scalindua japonica]|uniref:Histidinol-phosphatase n=1 Tax=Candidatus Scalindua japonica TaxID=1284222 RepID=A0A286U413_9BACT|nr:histidinol-phosphatase HisJ [Candidatus Scalindua japonica]GAX62852.1 histidinol phosphatase and related hydrolases of the PHP family [Candidatus Scalindua japonica]
MIDYHIHTSRCGHADGKMIDYVKKAIECGIDEIGFNDHLPLNGDSGKVLGLAMGLEELPGYVKEVKQLRKLFPQIRIKLGVEADYTPESVSYTRELLNKYNFDYVVGSVHYIGEWAFDHPGEREKWDSKDVDLVYKDYFELLRKSARTSLFDIIGHCDLVKKFGDRPNNEISQDLEDTAKVFKECGVAIEINTSGLRKPVSEIYPSCDILNVYQKYDIPIVFGSDAHTPDDVGRDFDKAMLLAEQAGYKEFVTFDNRKKQCHRLDFSKPICC